jgi:hypothetical protein
VPTYLWAIFGTALGLLLIMIFVVAFQGHVMHKDLKLIHVIKDTVGDDVWKRAMQKVDSSL